SNYSSVLADSTSDPSMAPDLPSPYDLDCAKYIIDLEMERRLTVDKNLPLSRQLARHLVAHRALRVIDQEDLIREREVRDFFDNCFEDASDASNGAALASSGALLAPADSGKRNDVEQCGESDNTLEFYETFGAHEDLVEDDYIFEEMDSEPEESEDDFMEESEENK
ncbi:hypothetical protein PFISCL1PPCAC_18397, partial [Pristionchus fissidentatus]